MHKCIKLFLLMLSIVGVFLIYKFVYKKGYNYVVIGNDYTSSMVKGMHYNDYVKEYLIEHDLLKSYSDDFSGRNYQISELLKDIKNNEFITKDGYSVSIKKTLRESDVVVLSLEIKDFLDINRNLKIDKINCFKQIDLRMIEINKLLKEIKKYAKKNLILIGVIYKDGIVNELDDIIKYINYNLEDFTDNLEINFINPNDMLFDLSKSLTDKECQCLAKLIINYL